MAINSRLVKWFNYKALAIQKVKIHGFCDEMDLASVVEDTTGQYYSCLREYLPNLIEENGQIHNLRLSEINETFFSNLEKIISEGNIYVLHLLLYCMDRAIVQCYDALETLEDEHEEIEGLNDNWRETGIIILKRASCAWQVRNIGSCRPIYFTIFIILRSQRILRFQIIYCKSPVSLKLERSICE